MRIVNVYAPNRESERAFFKNIQEHLSNCTPVDLLMIWRGDMNITIDNTLDKQNGNNYAKKSVPILQQIISDHNLCDIGRNGEKEMALQKIYL